MKKIVIGILAHVDAGKTTLSESILYLSGRIRKLGRVDHKDAFLDYDQQERNRGITIFSKQALIKWQDLEMTLIDTPGHVDFSAEMERTLQILDYAIIVINGNDGVQIHTKTIWNLLEHYQIPTFIFINKMDISPLSQSQLLSDIQSQLNEFCLDFTQLDNQCYENIALIDDNLLEEYMQYKRISDIHIAELIQARKLFPCYFGSALKLQGVQEFLDAIALYSLSPTYPSEFAAKVYKVTYDQQGNRLTHIKMTGGTLKAKQMIDTNEKVDQIRIYSGTQYQMVDEVSTGCVCALKGLKSVQPGRGLGCEIPLHPPVLSSYMTYRVVLPEGCHQHDMFINLQKLSEEDPQLHVTYHTQLDEIHIQLMGEIQIEILKNIIQERFGVNVEFDHGEILYKETILNLVEGVGHYEPLRHYAEVHLLLEPGPQGSGIQIVNQCHEDQFSRHWQRLILSHLEEKEHLGVLTGSPLTDIKITLVNGKAHQKHTEGGDFRQATYRAVRQGLMQAQSLLLEPYYQFSLDIPVECLSRAMYDLEMMHGQIQTPQTIDDRVMIEGTASVAAMQNYQSQVIAYSKGKGRLLCTMSGYQPCYHQEEVIQKINYQSENDLENPTGSVFCSHGAGFYVPWNEVFDYMHLPLQRKEEKHVIHSQPLYQTSLSEDEELNEIFTRTYGPVKNRLGAKSQVSLKTEHQNIQKPKPQCILVDGYNVIHAWKELKEIAEENLEGARLRLMDMMCNYQGYRNCLLILVFDAYNVKGNLGTAQQYHNIHIVYTKEAQTADMYIERVVRDMANDYQITVATSDALEQLIITGAGAYRMSSRELKLDLERLNFEKQDDYQRKQVKSRNYLLEDLKDYHQD